MACGSRTVRIMVAEANVLEAVVALFCIRNAGEGEAENTEPPRPNFFETTRSCPVR